VTHKTTYEWFLESKPLHVNVSGAAVHKTIV
jgi:hypothetical protein